MSTTKTTWNSIRRRPAIRSCLRQGLINYSALARQICKEERIRNFQAVLSACRRYGAQTKVGTDPEAPILKILREGHMIVTTHMAVSVVEKPRDLETVDLVRREAKKLKGEINIIEGRDVMTIFHSERLSYLIRKAFGRRVIRLVSDLSQITLLLDERFETTPGVVAYIYGLLAFEGINIREEASCGTDLILLVSNSDMQKTTDLFSRFWLK